MRQNHSWNILWEPYPLTEMCIRDRQLNEPVDIAFTSGTAVSNYLTGVTEAYYSRAPLLAMTCGRSPYTLHQLETQKIDQPAVFTLSLIHI